MHHLIDSTPYKQPVLSLLGQTCISTNRILVQSGIYDRFVAALAEAMDQQLTLGNGTDPGVNMGPLVNDAQMNKVTGGPSWWRRILIFVTFEIKIKLLPDLA